MNFQQIDELLKKRYEESRLPPENRDVMLDRIVQSCAMLETRRTVDGVSMEEKHRILRIRHYQKLSTLFAVFLLTTLICVGLALPSRDPEFVKEQRYFDNSQYLAIQYRTKIEIWWTDSVERGYLFPRIAF